jgi:lysozyme
MSSSRFRKAGMGVTSAGAMALALIGGFEGYSSVSYKDVIGVWTACQGLTKGIHKGMTFTKQECDAKFIDAIVEHEDGMRKCLVNPDSIPIKPYISYVSLAYNVGPGAICNGNMKTLINQGRYKDACNYMVNFNKAGGRIWKGLVNRRDKEIKFCLSGL